MNVNQVKAKGLLLFLPVPIMIVATLVFAISMIVIHGQNETYFATACGVVASMCVPLVAWILTARVKVTVKVKDFGGGFNVFVSTLICTGIVLATNLIANLRRLFTYQVEPWQIYTFYVVIAVGEEIYYRLMLCWGVATLLNSKNRFLGISGAAITSVMAFYAGSIPSIEGRLTWIIISTVVFIVFFIFTKKRNEAPGLVVSGIGVAISSIAFMAAHFKVYADYPEQLVALLVGALTMGAFLIQTKNPFVPFVAHVTNNLVALGGVVTNSILIV